MSEPRGESVVIERAALPWIVVGRIGWFVGVIVLGAIGAVLASVWEIEHPTAAQVVAITAILVLVRLIWQIFEWRAATMVVGPDEVRATRGIIQTQSVSVRLVDIAQVEVFRSARERLIGAGTVVVSSSAGANAGAGMRAIYDPEQFRELILRRVRDGTAQTSVRAAGIEQSKRRMPVIGIVGGIGAGKSHVAAVFAELGCVVLDSDVAAKAQLDDPAVKDVICSWWGNDVLDQDGKVDRKKVAAIVFADAAQRQRLEGLVHPRLKAGRAAAIAQARKDGRAGVIVDAPLLLEAGVDAECDAVVFVDAPVSDRLKRVMRGRGWTEQEFARRESAQWSIERKQAASHAMIRNDDQITKVELIDQVKSVLNLAAERASQST